MALEQHNTAFEFEAMLRSHLSRGGSVVEACAGFDADTASAYLEDALGAATRSHYDAHLAGCPSCRRSVIALSRLAPGLIEAEPYAAGAPARGWSHWKAVVAGWFDLSEWNLAARGWGLATAGAAGAVLLSVLATQLWRQSHQTQEVAVASATVGSQSDSAALSATTAPDGQMALNGDETARYELLTPERAAVPPPNVGPVQDNQNPATAATGTVESDAARNLGLALQPPSGNPVEALPPAPSPNVKPVLAESFAGGAGAGFTPLVESKQTVAPPEAPPDAANARILAPINPSPGDNPMTRSGRRPNVAPTPNVFDRAFAFVPSRKDATERKLEPTEIEEGAPKQLAVRVRDKVFNFRAGMWIDQAYKPDMAWRITKLVQNSDEYKRVLADEPQLKDFFERGSVIVVWKDKIYKVVAK